MIRKVDLRDAAAIMAIYNGYITDSVITFETEPLSLEEMRGRIAAVSADFPYWVYEVEGKIAGYCYAHPWKEKAAYSRTLETTVYLSPEYTGRGLGRLLMQKLIDDCRERGIHALIACITEGNEASCALHLKMGFKQVSRFHQVGWKFGRWLDVMDYQLLLVP